VLPCNSLSNKKKKHHNLFYFIFPRLFLASQQRQRKRPKKEEEKKSDEKKDEEKKPDEKKKEDDKDKDKKSVAEQVVVLPLTPALSPSDGERENRPQSQGRRAADDSSTTFETSGDSPRLFPLLLGGGEGQGEGAAPIAYSRSNPFPALLLTNRKLNAPVVDDGTQPCGGSSYGQTGKSRL